MKSDFLFHFIHALDEGQTRYCRTALEKNEVHAQLGYADLFNALHEMDRYDKERMKLAVSPYPIAGRLAVEKIRLYHLLLGHVQTLNDQRSSPKDQFNRFKEASVLFDMGLWEAAGEIAERGIEGASANEDLHTEVLLRDLVRKIYKNMSQHGLEDKRTHNEYALVTASRKLATLMRYNQINDRMHDYQRNYRVSDSSSVRQGFEELMQLPEMRDPNMADSLPSQIRYYTITAQYYSQINDQEKSIEFNRRLITLWEQKPERIKTGAAEYRTAVSNLIGKLNLQGKTDEAALLLQKLEGIHVSGRKNEILQFTYVELQFQLFYMNQGKLDAVLERENQVLNGLKRYQKHVANSSTLTLLYNLAVTYLILDKGGKATKYFDRIRGMGKLQQRQDIQGIARLLRLILLSEKRSELHFDHYLRNSQRFFRKKDRGYELEVMVHGWLQRYDRTTKAKDRQKEVLYEFIQLLRPYVDNRVLGAEEMLIWAIARHEDRSALTVFLERLNST